MTGLALSSFAFAFWYGVSGWKEMRDKNTVRQITVTGEGKIAAKPDLAIFMAGVVTEAARVKEAQSENTRRSNAMLEFLKQKGLEEKDIKTVGYSIFPQYKYNDAKPCILESCPPPRPPKIVSYQVRHTLEIRVRGLDKTDELLDGVVSNGANEVGSVNFSVEDKEKIKVEARKKAIATAKEKARVLAKDLSVRLGKITNFSESDGEFPIYARSFEALERSRGGVSAPAPRVETGEQEVRSTVTITYEFK